MHEASHELKLKGAWKRSQAQRKLARRRALSRRVGEPSASHRWEDTLIACWELADESDRPTVMPSYSTMGMEGLAPLAHSLRLNSASTSRPVPGGSLHPPTKSGLRFAAEALNLQLPDMAPVQVLLERGFGKGSVGGRGEVKRRLQRVMAQRGLGFWPGYRELVEEAKGREERGLMEVLCESIQHSCGGMLGLLGPDVASEDPDGSCGIEFLGEERLPYARRVLDVDGGGGWKVKWTLDSPWQVTMDLVRDVMVAKIIAQHHGLGSRCPF